MNLWIDQQREKLLEVLGRVDMVFVNGSEARQLSGRRNLFEAAAFLLDRGPKFAVVKMGAAGAMIFGGDVPFTLPAYPLDKVVDPTGAGDTFASGMLGYLAGSGRELDFDAVKTGLAYGSVNASFAVGDFGVTMLRTVTRESIDSRLAYYLSTNQLGDLAK